MSRRNWKLEIRNWGFYFLIIFLFLFFPFHSASALSVSPVRQTVVVDPGEEMIVSLDATNDTQKRMVVRPSVASFAIDEETGLAVFGDRDSAISWVKPSVQEIPLQPGEKKNIEFIIAVPASAEPVSHYLALFVGETPPLGEQIGIGARVGSLLYLHAGGERRESLIAEYIAPSRRFSFRAPIRLDVQVKNAGTIHVIPSGDVRVSDSSGEAVASFSVNPEQRTVLPNGRWSEAYGITALSWRQAGRLQADVIIRYGLTNQELKKEIVFWYVPLGAVVGIAGIIFCGIGGVLALGKHKTKRLKD